MLATDIIDRVRIILADPEHTRWPLKELILWLNDGQRAIATQKPNAVTETVEIPLVSGTRQTHGYLDLIRVLRNIFTSATPGPQVPGAAIYPTTRDILDAVEPRWGDPRVVPFSREVVNVMQDMAEPSTFYVAPGNNGEGIIEAVVSTYPAEVTPIAGKDANSPDAYAVQMDLAAIYMEPLVEYVIYRAYTKDAADPANAQLAARHYSQFAALLGIKLSGEGATRIGSTGQTE